MASYCRERSDTEGRILGIHLKAPLASRADQNDLRENFKNDTVFCAVSRNEREQIYSRILKVPGLIPSFDSFFDDCNYLESISNCIKRLIPRSVQRTSRETMEGFLMDGSRDFYPAYCSLAIFAMRFYDNMPKQLVLKDPLTYAVARADNLVLREFAKFALSLGFGNEQIDKLPEREPNVESDKTFMVRSQKPLLVWNGPKVIEKRRSGRSHRNDFESEQSLLSFECLNDGVEETGQENYVNAKRFLSEQSHSRSI